ncbi:MAG: Tol-Pal system beta propeller repeat protein TolB [Deltaproteobacteria bacterium]|nr:Tol-Pal system beta propeller repeat protein TolB [Deltaproteobacteria bacterium]
MQRARPGQRLIDLCACALLAAAVLGAGPASAQRPLIEIEGAAFRPFPIAVPDFKPRASAGADVGRELATVLRDDLSASGLFQVLDPRSFIASPEREGVTVGTIAFPAWLNVGADGLVKALIDQSGGEITVEVHVFDVVRGREIFKEQFDSAGQPRRLAHRIADALIAHYTGEKGLFLSRIAYVQRRGRSKDICVMDVDGHNASCVVRNNYINILPAWDGTGGLLFTSYLSGNTDLFRVDLASGATAPVSQSPGLNSGACVSPDGKRIALTLSRDGNSEIYVVDRSGKHPRRLTSEAWAIDSSPSWSPDGKRIAFVSDRTGNPQIYVMDADGSNQRRITFQGTYNQTPAWSPRGDRIAFTARDERNVFDIFTIEVAGGRVHRITQDQGNNEEPTWAPNGRMLAFTSDRQGSKAIWLSDPQGNHQRRISSQKVTCFAPTWSDLMPELR